ncbi:hypothetical protein [Bradyrhizobium sp. USDA 3458]|uniref:hypothetical protein n=1 Tax=Bradyrhizobium sp. USDA 3458 TaxID=2591461 RepID=UPI0011422C5E|nr:hypothetical protein [Bradyrhizobium sp. USDA 3458]
MARATHQSTTKPLSSLFQNPVLRAVFKAVEDEGAVEVYTGRDANGALVSAFRPRTLDGGAAARPELELA